MEQKRGRGTMDMVPKNAWKAKMSAMTAILAFLLITALVMSGCGNEADMGAMLVNAQEQETTLFYVTKNGLYAHDLSSGHKKQLDANADISNKMYPLLVSPDGNHIAYTAGDELYVTSTGFGEVWTQPVCVLSVPQAKNNYMDSLLGGDINYAWVDNNRLLYAKDDIIGVYDLKEGKAIDQAGDFRYENLTSGKEGIVYAKRNLVLKDKGVIDSGEDVTEIVQLNIDTLFAENQDPEEQPIKVLLSGSPLRPDAGDLGETYTIAGISPDKTKLFIWPHTYSASISADGTGEILVYDLLAADGEQSQDSPKSRMVVTVEEGILMYPDNIAASPADSGTIALNAGIGREMWINKRIGLFDIQNNSLTPVDFGCEVTMTPAWSPDGTLLACSGGEDGTASYMLLYMSEATITLEDRDALWNQIMARSIYLFDTETKESKRLTSVANVCDFAPTFINDENDIVFARWDEKQKNLSLIELRQEEAVTDEMTELMLAENLKYTAELEGNSLFGFYGHIDSKPYFTIWRP